MTSDKQTINTTEQCPWDAEHHLVTSYQHLSSTLSLQLIETHLSASMIISGDYWKENMLMQRLKKTTISLCSVVGRSSVKIYSIIDEPEKSFKNIFFQLALCMQRWKIFLSHTTKLKNSLETRKYVPHSTHKCLYLICRICMLCLQRRSCSLHWTLLYKGLKKKATWEANKTSESAI